MRISSNRAVPGLGLPAGSAGSRAESGLSAQSLRANAGWWWSFLVDHPFIPRTRFFAGGVTLNYAHLPLVFGLGSAADRLAARGP